MRILVTGVAGFIGSRLARNLLDRGDQVVGFDNLNDYYPLVHKQRHLADLSSHPRFTFVECDLRDLSALVDLCRTHPPDAVAHIAAMASVRYSVQNPHVYSAVNVQGTMNLLDAVNRVGKPHCLLASTGSVYGRSTPTPFVETAPADRPLAPYPASKRSMELFAHSFEHLWALPITILRFFNVYGPHGRPDMMPWQWATDILAGRELTLYDAGRLKRDWTYIDDITAGFRLALDRPHGYQIFNLGCGEPVENIEFVRILEKLLGREALIRNVPAPASEPPVTFADITLARRTLGYQPQVRVQEGLSRFIAWMREAQIIH